mgnify:CR=1 FL=1
MTEKKKDKGRQWDGITRPSNDTYAKNWHDIFGKKTKDEITKENEEYLKDIKDKI